MPWDAKAEEDYLQGLERACLNPAYALCAGIEIINGRGKAIENQFSAALCERLGMHATAASDSHAPADIGRCATEFLKPVDGLESLIGEHEGGSFPTGGLECLLALSYSLTPFAVLGRNIYDPRSRNIDHR